MARFRGSSWGKKKTRKKGVEWHEIKTGVFYRQEQLAHTESGRGLISEKVIVRWKGEPLEFGRRLGWEALRGGLSRAKETLALADGGGGFGTWSKIKGRTLGNTHISVSFAPQKSLQGEKIRSEQRRMAFR